jgi:D-alanyl-D-alanine carboxypeptidase
MDELVWGMLLNSANDAAVAAAQATSPDGTMAAFNTLMNDKARSLGATSSTFGNPTGLDSEETRSTARDMAMITAAVLQDPFLSKIISTRTHDISWGDGTKKTLVNQNKLLGQLDGAIGVKMGYTDDAGRTMIAAARRGDTTLISVLLNVPEPTASSAKLLDWGFANLASLRSSSNERIDPSNLAQPSHGLEVVVIDGETSATTSGLPPLLAPLAAMIAAFVIYRLVRRWGEPPAGPPKHRVSPVRERVRV